MSVLGLIPARKGSKRLPGKNILPLSGKPLIVWTIEAAKQSKLITHLVCSTDDEKVMQICLKMGVDVIVRPDELATDEATSESVVLHALEYYPCDYVCLLQPTSPFRTAGDIDACLSLASQGCTVTCPEGAPFDLNGAVYAVSVGDFRKTGFVPKLVVPMLWERSIDIDAPDDFNQAEAYASALRTT